MDKENQVNFGHLLYQKELEEIARQVEWPVATDEQAKDRRIGPAMIGISGLARGISLQDLINQLAKENIHVTVEADGRCIFVSDVEHYEEQMRKLKEMGFNHWPTESFTPAHAMAYDQEVYRRLLEEQLMLGPEPERKTPKQQKDDLRKFLERKQGRSRFK